jgi:hypothetical protein
LLNPPRRSPTAACFPLPRQHSDGSPTTSAVARPDGTLLKYQPYGRPGLLIADLDLTEATGTLAARLL